MPNILKSFVCAVLTVGLALPGVPALAGGDAADAAMHSIRPEAIRGDMRFLSDDSLEGRGTGTRGHEIAAKFMAAEFEAMGLTPVGDAGTYFQTVPLRSARVDEAKTSLTLIRSGQPQELVFRQDYIAYGNPGRAEGTVEAPVVYAGFGVTAPDQNYDDYKGIDAKGKIVAIVHGAPNFDSALKAQYSSSEIKKANAVAHGAVGMIVLYDPILEALYSFHQNASALAFPDMSWLDKENKPNDFFPELKGEAILSLPAAKKFFEGSGHSADEAFEAAKEGKSLAFAMPMTARIHNQSELKDVSSPNVVAKLEGSDPTLKNEYLLYSAHLDHLGIGEPVNGDSIYNGALDNASGCAILLEVARAFTRMNPRPKRSILFLAVTGEEEGLLGSDYFGHYPTVSKAYIAANVNMDEDVMLWPLRDVIAYGAEHSSLEGVVEKAAKRLQMIVSPDPAPEETIFIRSDQYSLVKQGIPSVFPVAGFKSIDPAIDPAAIFKKWEETRYHEPQDDMQQPGLDFDQAVKYAQFIYLCGWLITQDAARPSWNAKDFFGEHYGKKM
jgi:Zn-dependent M28 family amino/carboxypeptidase